MEDAQIRWLAPALGWYTCQILSSDENLIQPLIQEFWRRFVIELESLGISPDWEYLHVVLQADYGEFAIRTWKDDPAYTVDHAFRLSILEFDKAFNATLSSRQILDTNSHNSIEWYSRQFLQAAKNVELSRLLSRSTAVPIRIFDYDSEELLFQGNA